MTRTTPLLIFGLGMGLVSTCWGQTEKLSIDLQGRGVPADLDVIIQYKQSPSSTDHSKVISKGGTHRGTFSSIRAGLYRVPASAIAELAKDPNVAYISPDRPLHANLDQAQATIGASAAATYGLTGSGVGVCLLYTSRCV